jgi:hypothetical protein
MITPIYIRDVCRGLCFSSGGKGIGVLLVTAKHPWRIAGSSIYEIDTEEKEVRFRMP